MLLQHCPKLISTFLRQKKRKVLSAAWRAGDGINRSDVDYQNSPRNWTMDGWQGRLLFYAGACHIYVSLRRLSDDSNTASEPHHAYCLDSVQQLD